jgi:signal transduction histidine kinase
MLENLDSRNKELISVAATVAHELKNPLSSIQGLAQLMARQCSPGSKEAERLEVMRREIARMSRVLDEFRNFSRPLSGLSLQQVEVSVLVRDVLALTEGLADERKVTFVAPASKPTQVECDPHKVKQALLNLVQNALDASPQKSTIRINVELDVSQTIAISVIDSGKGIASEIVDRLFTPGLTTKTFGSGIGLVVARSIAAQHGGQLSVSNAPGGGCIACLRLPCSQPKGSEIQL